jgi:hypothetical protein
MRSKKPHIPFALRFFGVLFLLPALFIFWTPVGRADESLGVATFVQGKVVIYRNGVSRNVMPDTPIFADDIIDVGPKSQARLVFAGDSVNGLKSLAEGLRFEVADLLGQKPAERTLTELPAEIARILALKEPPPRPAAGSDQPTERFARFVVFPTPSVLGTVTELLWLPIPDATSYRVQFEKPNQEFTTLQHQLTEGLPAFGPGSSGAFTVEAFRGDELLASEDRTFAVMRPAAPGEKRLDTLIGIDDQNGDPDDPTPFLLKEAEHCRAGFPGNALLEVLQYARRVGSPDHTFQRLTIALRRCGFTPEDLQGIDISKLIPD